MASKRKLKRAQRQLTLARIARRDAMSALADALAEEQRSASLASRSRDLAQGYSERAEVQSADMLSQNTRFAGELSQLARHADKARGDASRQAQWQAEALASAEQKIERLDGLRKEALAQQRSTQERADRPPDAPMARKLQP